MANNTTTAMDALSNRAFLGTRVLFYALKPEETYFRKIEDVPNYTAIVMPIFFVFILLEIVVNALSGAKKSYIRHNDAMSSISQGLIMQLPLMVHRSIELTAYTYVYSRWRVAELAWDSPLTWLVTMLGTDLGYYWLHRMAHELNFMWAGHQVHHSSQDFNLSTALRQSLLQKYSTWPFYMPMAFFIPPQVFYVHKQLNLLYQFWIHTEVVGKLGPLEWILNTPSHHRVHHGRNRYCIDKNYAGVLIIWDRMFGTFAEEDDNDTIAYGLVHPVNSWDSIYIQMCHWKYLISSIYNKPSHAFSILFKGPGWVPGKGRLGDITDIPDIHGPQPKYDKTVPWFLALYTWTHFFIFVVERSVFDGHRQNFSMFDSTLLMLYFLWTVTNIGYIYEQKWYAAYLELLRCVVTLLAESYICGGTRSCGHEAAFTALRGLYFGSTALWLLLSAKQLGGEGVEKKQQ